MAKTGEWSPIGLLKERGQQIVGVALLICYE
jgi:hypothetical protein